MNVPPTHDDHEFSELLNQAFLESPIPCCIKDVQLRIRNCNKAFENLHGFSKLDIVGKTSIELLGEAGQLDHSMDLKALDGNSNIVYDTAIINSELQLRELIVTKKSIHNSQTEELVGLACYYCDQTEINSTQRELGRMRVVMDNAQDTFLVIERETMSILDCNNEANKSLQLERDELVGKNPCSIMPQLSEDKLKEILATSARKEDQNQVLETLIMRKDGSVFESEIQICPVTESLEDLMVLGIHDVSNRKRSERELKQANTTLRLIGSVNKTLINASSEEELMSEMCEKIAEADSFVSVFGLVSSDASHGISSLHQNAISIPDVIGCLSEFEFQSSEIDSILSLDTKNSVVRRTSARMKIEPGSLPKWIVPKFGSFLCVTSQNDDHAKTSILIFAKDAEAFEDGNIKLLQELSNEIAYGVWSLREKKAKTIAEQRIEKQLSIESAIARFSSSLLASQSLESGTRKALPNLLKASEACQVFLYEMQNVKKEKSIATRACEFKAAGENQRCIAPPEINLSKELPRWERMLSDRRSIDSKTSSFPPEECEVFKFDRNSRVLIYPLHAGEKWIGFLGINISTATTKDLDPKKEMLAMAANLLAELYARERADRHMKMLASAINNSNEGVIITKAEESFLKSGILFVNDALCRMTGYSIDRILDEPADFIQSKKATGESIDSMEKDIEQFNAHTGEIIATRRDGSSFHCERRVYPITNDEGKLCNYLCILRDITEKKELESRVTFANKMESIGQLSAGIAHEINTPSQFIGDNLSFLSDGWSKIEPIIRRLCDGEHLDRIIQEADLQNPPKPKILSRIISNIPEAISDANEGVERISTIVNAMREFSHPEKRMTLADINKCIYTTVTVARNEWKYISNLETDLSDDLPLIECMPGDINQVILNMIVNAAQAIEERIGESHEKGEIRIKSAFLNNNVRISISDTGNGIPEEIRNSIFDPFFTTKEVGKGTGQGLFMAHSIIEKNHHGKLAVESEMGVGTTFHIDLPVSSPETKDHERN